MSVRSIDYLAATVHPPHCSDGQETGPDQWQLQRICRTRTEAHVFPLLRTRYAIRTATISAFKTLVRGGRGTSTTRTTKTTTTIVIIFLLGPLPRLLATATMSHRCHVSFSDTPFHPPKNKPITTTTRQSHLLRHSRQKTRA